MQIRPICVDLSKAPTSHDSLINIADCIIMLDELKAEIDRDFTEFEANLLAEMANALSLVRCAKKYGFDYRVSDDDEDELDLFIYQRLGDDEGHEIN